MEETIENTFEIKDSEVDIKDIERQIQKNIIDRKKLGAYSTDAEIEDIIKRPLLPPPETSSQNHTLSQNRTDISSHMNYINSNWDIHAEYNISSHRPIIGRLLVLGRRIINNEVRRYVDILIGRQSEFNSHLTSILSDSNSRIDDINKKVNDTNSRIDDIYNKVNDTNSRIDDISNKVNDIHSRIDDIDNKINSTNSRIDDIDNKINSTNSRIDDINKKNDINNISCADKIYGNMNYFVFNELFGGSNEEIRINTEQFLDFFSGCKNVLDIGSGRGIFLELLKEKCIKGYGIDTNDDLILYCKRKDLNVQKDDVMTHLKKLNNKSLDGIFISHVIEHLKYEDTTYMLKLCYEKMQYGSYMVIVTPNIYNMTVSSNTFYTDPTHISHIHPEFIKFLLRTYGFRDIQERFYQPTSKDQMLKKVENICCINDEQQKTYEIMNHNVHILNNLLFGYRDYAIIAKK